MVEEDGGRRLWMARGVVAAAAVLTFARGVPGPLVSTWDDGRFLIDFEPVHRVSLESLRRIWTEVHFQAWHPLHLTSYWLDVPWAGAHGPVLHAVNLALWVLALWLVLAVLRRLGLPLLPAVAATLVYGLHPVQVEAVTWATGRKEILALMLASGAILAHLSSERWTDGSAWLSRGLYVLAALAKTTVLPLPGLLFLIDVLLRGVPVRRALGRQVPAVLMGAGLGAGVVAIWQEHEMIRPDAGGRTPTGSVALVAATFGHHLATALWPASTSPVYPIDRTGDFGAVAWIGPAVLVLGLALAWRLRARRAGLALAGFVLLLSPVSNVIPVYFQYQDRYLSLPLLPLAFGFGAAVHLALEQLPDGGLRRLALALAAAAVLALSARTIQYQGAWSADERLWEHATSTHPDAFYAWMKLGELHRDQGELEAALDAYDHAIEVEPSLRLGHAARFYTVALRDERRHDLSPSRAFDLSRRYHARADDAARLRDLATDMEEAGYRDATLLALDRSLDLSPVSDERLEAAAAYRHDAGQDWIARFLVSRMSRPPIDSGLREMLGEGGGGTGE